MDAGIQSKVIRSVLVCGALGLVVSAPVLAATARVNHPGNIVRDGSFVTPVAGTAQPNAAPSGGNFTSFCAADGLNVDCPAAASHFGAWTVTNGSIDLIAHHHWTVPHGSPAGTQTVDMDGRNPGTISQTLHTKRGETYSGSFMLSGNPDGIIARSYNRMLWTALRRKAAYLPG
jgi:hypothetical protein